MEILGEGRALCHELVGQFQHLLEIHVPGDEPHLAIEHRDAVAHVVEGDAQFGLTLPDLVQSRALSIAITA